MKRIPIPVSIRVGAHDYSVEMTAGRVLDANGDCDFDKLRIRLAKRMRRSKLREIIVHEILHACAYPTDLDEEPFVTVIAPVLVQVIRDNPQLIDFLREP